MTYDNTDERGEDAVARQRGGSEPGHLPECGWSEPCQPMHGGNPYANHYAGTIGGQTPDPPYCSNCAVWCICDRLRACEARVFVDRTDHWNAALDAARDAVAALPWKVAVSFGPIDCNQSCQLGPCSCSGVMRPEAWTTGPDDALAAIDALRGESNG